MSTDLPKKYVAVLVHGDVWGAYNANKLVQAVVKRGAIPILIVTRSTPGKDCVTPITKIDDLKLPRVLKEQTMLKYFEAVDALVLPETAKPNNIFTFNSLAKRYMGRNEAFYTTSGGKAGGQQILDIFKSLEGKGVKPEVVLSGDTLALLPPEITSNYDCFGTHPGPLPEIKGMQGTARSLINSVLYDWDGKRLPRNHQFGMGLAHVKGSLFNLATNLDEGPVIETALSPAVPGMCLLHIRSDLYHALTDVMVKHLGTLMDAPARKALLEGARKKKNVHEKAEPHESIAELEAEALKAWMSTGAAHFHLGGPEEMDEVIVLQNTIINPDKLRNLMHAFYPKGHEGAFHAKFDELFKPGLAELQAKLQEYMEPGLRLADHLSKILKGQNTEIKLMPGMFAMQEGKIVTEGTLEVRFKDRGRKDSGKPPQK